MDSTFHALIESLLEDGARPNFSSRKAEWNIDQVFERLNSASAHERAQHVHLINQYRHPKTGASLASHITHFVGHGWNARRDLSAGHFMHLLDTEGIDVFATDARGRHPALYAVMRQDNFIASDAVAHSFEKGLDPFSIDREQGLSFFSGSFLGHRQTIFPLLYAQADAVLGALPEAMQIAALDQVRALPLHPAHESWMAEKRALALDKKLPASVPRRSFPRF